MDASLSGAATTYTKRQESTGAGRPDWPRIQTHNTDDDWKGRKKMVKLSVSVLLALMLALGLAGSSSAVTVYSEDFNSGNTSGWNYSPYYPDYWSVTNNALQCTGYGGGASHLALRSDVTMPTDWTFDCDVQWTESYNPGDPQYGSAGIALSSLSNGIGSNAILMTFSRSLYDVGSSWTWGRIWVDVWTDGSYAPYYLGVFLDQSGTGSYHVSMQRAPGSNDIVCTLTGAGIGTPQTLTVSRTAAQADALKYPGVAAYFSREQFDNILITSTAVPEPASIFALLAGFTGLAGLRRRKA